MPKHLLTKAAFVSGLNCERYLWVFINDRERLPEPDESIQPRFVDLIRPFRDFHYYNPTSSAALR